MKVEGLKELDAALGEIGKAAAKAVLKRVGLKALKPVADAARSIAPDDPETQGNDLRSSIGVGTKLSPNQARQKRSAIKAGEEKYFVEVYAGAGPLPQAHLQEFGAKGDPPQPFLRPSWDSHKGGVLETIKSDMGGEIIKTAKRQAARRARMAAKG